MASLIAGGASAAPGGNGKGQGLGLGQGKGLALAKGHAKHDHATPQLVSPPGAEPEAKPKASAQQLSSRPAAQLDKAPPPGEATRHNHVTICHATGSGRYIVISPNVNGANNGHLSHHDDFVYQGSCARGEAPSPSPEEPVPPTTGGGHPPRDEAGGVAGAPAVRPSGDLPFTGMPALPLGLLGGALVLAGILVARRKPAEPVS